MDTSKFRIKSIGFYNWGSSAELNGSIELCHEGTNNEMRLKLNSADCSKIVNIIADRLAETIHEAARQFWVDVGMPMTEFGAQTAQGQIGETVTTPQEDREEEDREEEDS